MATKRSEVSLLRKLSYLTTALNDDYIKSGKAKTDVIGIACQYSSNPKLKREDFNELLPLTINEIIKKVQNKKNDNIRNHTINSSNNPPTSLEI